MRWDYASGGEDFDVSGSGLYILCEGNFQYGNATLSYYDPESGEVLNEVFSRANGMRLGDVAQSMSFHDGKGWIVVNNSRVIFAIDPLTFREVGRISGFTSPRYMLFVDDGKAYVSQMWDNRIAVVNPRNYEITGYISVPGMAAESGSTEQMVRLGRYVYCTCWSYQNSIIRIDTESDEVVGKLEVGIQPSSMVLDGARRLWVLTDGGYEGSPYGFEAPSLLRIDPETFEIDRRFTFRLGSSPRSLVTSGDGDTLYWINDAVWRMDVESDRLPVAPFLEFQETKYYGLTVDPRCGDVYVADAIDYMQSGMIYRYSAEGRLIDSFYVGVTPGAFCWKP